MSEQSPEQPPRFASPRDEALYAMWQGAWAFESSGDVLYPEGRFSYLSNLPAELDEIGQVFDEEFAAIGIDTQQLVGNFVLRERVLDGPIEVTEYPSEDAARGAYKALEAEYSRWLGDDV